MSWMAVKPVRYGVQAGSGVVVEHRASTASGSMRQTPDVPGRNGKPMS